MTKASRRYYRTIVLGVAAMGVLLWSATDQFGIPWEHMLELFLATLLVMVIVIIAAAVCVALWKGLSKLLHRRLASKGEYERKD